jgi:Fis family transcriptional regulator
LGDETPHDLYTLFMQAAERPLLEVVLLKAKGNQVRAAQWLGLNRNTLRKKLVEHGLI